MLKFNKKILFVFTVLFILLSTTCLAATTSSANAKLEVVENNTCTVNIQNTATYERKLVSYDLEKKELNFRLQVTNTASPIFNEPAEIFLVIDNSKSMRQNVTTSKTRLQAVTDSAKTFATELLKNENVKIGVVSFSTGDVATEGTMKDATLKTVPTANKETVLSSITAIANGELGDRTNIDAGITLANQNFSKDCKSKYLILLTDGVPNTTTNGVKFTYSGETATQTKAKLQSIAKSGVTIYSVMTGIPDTDIEPTTGKAYKALAEEIFGTTTKPTVGEFYYITDDKIESTICTTILGKFLDTSKNTLTNLNIHEFLPQEIVDNYDFSYITKPTKGTISPKINTEDNSIIWSIDKLEPKESATVSYKLKLKDNIDDKILDVVLNTNEKVEITANEIKTADGTNKLVSKVTPKVRVTMPKVEVPKDNTVAEEKIPQTGNTPILFFIVTITIITLVFCGVRYYIINRDVR